MSLQTLSLPTPAFGISLPAWARLDRDDRASGPRPAAVPVARPALAPANDGRAVAADEEAALLGRVAKGDEAALAALYDRLSGVALAVLTRLLGPAGEAEEVLQEVFLQVWRQAPSYDPGRASVRSWVLLLARSRGLDRLKSGVARRRREEEVMREEGVAVAALGCERLEDRERRVRVRAALAGLPSEQRRAVELAFFNGMTHVEISAHLGEPLGTVKSRILLGLRKLRTALAEVA